MMFAGTSGTPRELYRCPPMTEGNLFATACSKGELPFSCLTARYSSGGRNPLCDSILSHMAQIGHHCSPKGPGKSILHHRPPIIAYPMDLPLLSIPDSPARSPSACKDFHPSLAITIQPARDRPKVASART